MRHWLVRPREWPKRGLYFGDVDAVTPGPGPDPDPDPDPVVSDTLIVSLTGNDTTGDGTIDLPYRTLTKAAAEVTPGQTIYLRGGTYDTPGTDCYYTPFGNPTDERTGSALDFRAKATNAGARITIRSYPGELAVLDGANHSYWPRQAEDPYDHENPNMMRIYGEYITLSHITFKRSVGKGLYIIGNYNEVKNFHTHSHHSDAIYAQGANNLFQDIDGHHVWSVNVGGNAGDCIKMINGSTLRELFGESATTTDNTIRRVRAWLNCDDGFDIWSSKNTLVEDCVAYNNGYGSSGNGIGFKSANGSNANAGNVIRRCVGVQNRIINFDNNLGVGVTFDQCTSYKVRSSGIGFNHKTSTLAKDGSAGVNTSRNCVSFDATYTHSPSTDGEAYITYVNNTWDVGITDPLFQSVDPASANFLRLSSGSSCRSAGESGEDLGAIQYGAAHPVPMTTCDLDWNVTIPSAYAGSDAYPEWG